ncbi:MAG TPA: glycosyltransferase family 87 protein, partial [Fimbriiglobus sp.]
MKESYIPSAGPTRRAVRWLANYGLIVLPILACAAVLLLMRPDAPKARPDVPITLKWLVYDECDVGAYALRGINATVGRLPGRLDEPERQEPEDLAAALDAKQPPLATRYYLEYPTPTLLLFRLGYLLNPDAQNLSLPPALADSHHNGLANFDPRNELERKLWTAFRFAYRVYYAVMAAGLVALILVLRWGYEPDRPVGSVWLCALPGAVFFSLNRFDILPVLATAIAFAFLGRRRFGLAGVFLAAGILLKVYPVLFVPIFLRYLGIQKAIPFLWGFVGTLAAGFAWCLWATDWQGTVNPILVQLNRAYEDTSWTLYDRTLPSWLARHGEVR